MNAFVTGASGFVGWHLARVLLDRGDRVRWLVRPPSPSNGLSELPVEAPLARAVEWFRRHDYLQKVAA